MLKTNLLFTLFSITVTLLLWSNCQRDVREVNNSLPGDDALVPLDTAWITYGRTLERYYCACKTPDCFARLLEELARLHRSMEHDVISPDAHAKLQWSLQMAQHCTLINNKPNRWLIRAYEVERRYCGCEGKECWKRFNAEMLTFRQELEADKLADGILLKIDHYVDNARRCAEKQLNR